VSAAVATTFNPQRLVFGAYLLGLIAVAEIIIGHFALPAWPAFMVMIFFFVEHMDIKKAPAILAGGTFGIALVIVAKLLVTALAPLMGLELAKLTFVLAVVFAIVALGEVLPLLFNNYAFMFLTVSGVAAQAGNPKPLLWMAMSAIGGALLIAGVVGIGKWMARSAPQTASPELTSP
jgi:hypothetical protein